MLRLGPTLSATLSRSRSLALLTFRLVLTWPPDPPSFCRCICEEACWETARLPVYSIPDVPVPPLPPFPFPHKPFLSPFLYVLSDLKTAPHVLAPLLHALSRSRSLALFTFVFILILPPPPPTSLTLVDVHVQMHVGKERVCVDEFNL